MTELPELPQFGLADFDNPPVVETVLSLQFERLAALRAVHFGLFWRKVRDRFPKSEEQPPLLPVFEHFPEAVPPSGQIQFEAIQTPTLPRVWLINDAGTEIIQVQNDRFIKNWRKSGEHDVYPHYEPDIRPAFERDLKEFKSFLSEENLGELKVTQCEVTYVNHIISGEGWQRFDEFSQIFRFWQQTATPVPGNPEDFGIRLRFPLVIEGARPIGRLHVEVQPAYRATDGRPMYVMNLTARGLHRTELDFFDVGRQWIVRSFEQLTTESMHNVWRKK